MREERKSVMINKLGLVIDALLKDPGLGVHLSNRKLQVKVCHGDQGRAKRRLDELGFGHLCLKLAASRRLVDQEHGEPADFQDSIVSI